MSAEERTSATAGTAATRFDRRLVAPMILGSILNPINSSIIAVALVPIGRALGADTSATAWLVSSLYLATAIGQPLVGRLVDTFGPRRLFLIGTALTGIAGILGTFAPGLGVLIAARVVLGFGTCAGYPAAMYLIRREATRTGQASPAGILTAIAVATQTVAVVGPTIGGLLIGFGGWRSTFAVNIPLAIAGIVLGMVCLPRTATGETSDGRIVPRGRIDLVGIGLFAAMLVALLLFLMDLDVAHWWLAAIAVAAGAGFAMRELRVVDPFIDVRVFAGNAPLMLSYARGLLTATVSYAFVYGFTQWLEEGRGLSASLTGIVLLPVFGVAIVVSSTTGRRPEIKGKLVVGAAVQVVACVMLLVLGGGTAFWYLLAIGAAVGISQGLLGLANQNAVFHQADPARVGASSGLLRTFMYLGAILASSASGGFFGARATTSGMHDLAVFMIVVSALMLVMTVVDRSLALVGRSADARPATVSR